MTDVADRPPAGNASSRAYRRAALWFLLGVAVIVAAVAIAQPGLFRLVFLQPVRDLAYFNRELQPMRNLSEIATHRPMPSESTVLRAGPGQPADIDIEADLWLPTRGSAAAVVLLHGSSPRGRKLGFNMQLARSLQSAGWLVISPDARGFGGSESPANVSDPAAWLVHRDIERVVAYARRHPQGSGVVVAVGHSMGGSNLLHEKVDASGLSALVVIGPSRHTGKKPPSLWQRIRFSTDRKMGRAIPVEVAAAWQRQHDLSRLAHASSVESTTIPVLLMDGEREGEALTAMLREVAAVMGPRVRHVTVPGSHHYCGAYQLPLTSYPVFVHPEIYDRCTRVILDFLAAAVPEM